jgi:hypothetical protein
MSRESQYDPLQGPENGKGSREELYKGEGAFG